MNQNEQQNGGEPLPSLLPVILWLEAGCDPKHAATELRMYEEKRAALSSSASEPVGEPTDEQIGAKWAELCTGNYLSWIEKMRSMIRHFASPLPQEPSEATQVCYEAYQVVGSLLSDLGRFGMPEAERILDNLSQAKLVHKNVLPWPSYALPQEVKALTEDRTPGAAGSSRKPVFGEWMRGIWASEQNPQRDGRYVRTIRRTGRLNPGTSYELTDGKGSFWEYPVDSTVFLDGVQRELRAAQEVKAGEAEFSIENDDGVFLASASGLRDEAWREIQHYAAQYAEEGPLTIYEVTRTKVATLKADSRGEKE